MWEKPDAQTHPVRSTAYTLVFLSQRPGQPSAACLAARPSGQPSSPRACRVHEDSSQWRRTLTGSCSVVDPPRRCSLSSRSLHQHCHRTHQECLLPRCPHSAQPLSTLMSASQRSAPELGMKKPSAASPRTYKVTSPAVALPLPCKGVSHHCAIYRTTTGPQLCPLGPALAPGT